MKNYDLIEFNDYTNFITKMNSVIDVSCLDYIPKTAHKYSIRMFNTRKSLIEYLKESSQNLNSYIILNGSLKDFSKDLVVIFLDGTYTDLDEIVIGGHYE